MFGSGRSAGGIQQPGPTAIAAMPRIRDAALAVGASSATLGALRFVEASRVPASHKNKFGHDYLPPPPTSPVYP